MLIRLGAEVRTRDGKSVGKVGQLIVNPDKHTLDGFAVHTGWIGGDQITPIGDVQQVDADATIHLTIPESQFRSLPPLVWSSLASPTATDDTLGDYAAGGGQLPMTVASPGASVPSVGQEFDPGGGAFIGMSSTGYNALETESNLQEGQVTIAKGAHVVATDGHTVGAIHEVRASADGKIEGFVVVSGHLITHEHFVPADDMDVADPRGVRLRVTAAQFAARTAN